jgi:hypothetical protein
MLFIVQGKDLEPGQIFLEPKTQNSFLLFSMYATFKNLNPELLS